MNTFPPPEPARHSIADLLTLVGAIRRIAYDVTLEAGDALRRIRDLRRLRRGWRIVTDEEIRQLG